MLRIGLIQTSSDLYQNTLINSYDVFDRMSKIQGIHRIEFNCEKCVIELFDKRKFIFNPHIRASRLYSIPKIGTFEKKESEYISKLIKMDDICIDVGASFGWYTILLGKNVGESGLVLAFEPLPENCMVLSNNIKENKLNNVKVMPIALGDTKTDSKLYLPDIGISGSLELHNYRRTFDEIECKIDTLDSIVEEEKINRIDFIKADIEGGELAFLKGAINSISKFKPNIMLEIQENSTKLFGYLPDDIFKIMCELGYNSFYIVEDKFTGQKLCPVKNHTKNLPDYNFLFIHNTRSNIN